jgi:tetratricopeptide (TPR) repeat protein
MTTGRGVFRRCALVAALVLGPATAAAQEGGAPEATATSSAAAGASAEDQARQFASEGAEAFRDGQYLQAVAAFQKAYDLIPRPTLAYNIARSHERLSQWEEAIEWYERYLKLAEDPRDKAEVLDKIEILKKRVAPDDASPDAKYQARIAAGRKAYTAGDYEGAIAEFKAAFDLKASTGALFNIAKSYEKMGRYEEAIDYFQQYLDLDPKASDRADIEESIKRLKQSIRSRFQELSVASDPPGADIYLDDRNTGLQGQTNFRFKVTPGPHTLYVDLNGFEPVKREFVMPDDKPLALDFKLKKLENVGVIDIVVNHDGARIFVDGAIIGLSPYKQKKQLEAGKHQVQVELLGYNRWTGEVDLAKDETKLVNVELVEYVPPVADSTLSSWGRNLMLAGIIGGGLGFGGPLVYQKLIRRRPYYEQLGPDQVAGDPFYKGPLDPTDPNRRDNGELKALKLTQLISAIAGGALAAGGLGVYMYKWLRKVPPAPVTADTGGIGDAPAVSITGVSTFTTQDGAAFGLSGSF